MHQPAAEPRPSLYHRYRVHEAWHPPEGREPPAEAVVIVGAGPAGLVTALELARHGVPSVLLNAELQVSAGSRAIVFTRRTLEILQQVGVADAVVRAGLAWRCGTSHFRGQPVFRMEAPHDPHERFHPMTNLQQPLLEELLAQACEAQPLITLRWGNRCTALQQDADRARLTVDTPAGPYTQDARWVVAADGGRSGLRAQLGLKLEGAAYEGFFVIADIQVDLPLPTERLAFFDPPWNPGNTVLMHREPQGIWRVDYQLPPGESPEDALRPEALKARIDAQLAMIGHAGVPWQLDWSSVYSARALTLPDYRCGRVLFVGDAAHLLPIFGVRGANTAFQDAQSLGWQLAHVVKGLAGEALLANFSAERVGAAREIIDEAGKSTRFMAPPSRGFRLLRDAVLSLSLSQAFVRPLYHWRTSRPHAYGRSALNALDDDDARFDAGPGHGAPPANVRLGPHGHLLDHLGGGFDLLLAGGPGGPTEDRADGLAAELDAELAAELDSWCARGVAVRLTTVGPRTAADGGPGAQRATSASSVAVRHLPDADGQLRARWGLTQPGRACLLRPDQHLCARWLSLDARRLRSALQRALPA